MLNYLKQGKIWFITLITFFILAVSSYIIIHLKSDLGREVKTLSNNQFKSLVVLLSEGGSPTDSLTVNFDKRNEKLFLFLESALGEDDLVNLNPILLSVKDLPTKDLLTLIEQQEFIVRSFFWFEGYESYAEVIFWALMGVLLGLIYYVGNANRIWKVCKTENDCELSVFDYREIYDHIAKIIYAPASTLVIILGYNYIVTDNTFVHISSGKGMLVFSFLSGFYSGRVMKFLDKLKDLILPNVGSSESDNIKKS